jgi:hypothetical protein
MVSTRTTSSGLTSATSSATGRTWAGWTLPSNGSPKASKKSDGGPHPVEPRAPRAARRAPSRPRRWCSGFSGERLRDRQGVADLVHAGPHRPLVAPLVQDQARLGGDPVAVQAAHPLFRAGHLGGPIGVEEARRLDARDAGGCEPAAQLCPHLGRQALLLVLQAVVGPDLHYSRRTRHPSPPAKGRALLRPTRKGLPLRLRRREGPQAVGSRRVPYPSASSSSCTSTAPTGASAPSLKGRDLTRPARGAVKGCSIFIASRTSKSCPS